MKRLILATALCAATAPALAEDVLALQGASVRLGAHTGVIFFTEESDGYHVTITVAAEGGAPVRLSLTLAEGQQAILSTPGDLGGPAHELAIARDAGKLVLLDPIPALAVVTP